MFSKLLYILSTYTCTVAIAICMNTYNMLVNMITSYLPYTHDTHIYVSLNHVFKINVGSCAGDTGPLLSIWRLALGVARFL